MRKHREGSIGKDTDYADLLRGDRVKLVPDGIGGGHVDDLPTVECGKVGIIVGPVPNCNHKLQVQCEDGKTANCWGVNLKLLSK